MEAAPQIGAGNVAMLLVRYASEVRRQLSEQQKLEEFANALGRWHAEYPATTEAEVRAKTVELIAIVHGFGIEQLLVDRSGPSGPAATRGPAPVRTRGTVRQAARPSAEALRQVVATYCPER